MLVSDGNCAPARSTYLIFHSFCWDLALHGSAVFQMFIAGQDQGQSCQTFSQSRTGCEITRTKLTTRNWLLKKRLFKRVSVKHVLRVHDQRSQICAVLIFLAAFAPPRWLTLISRGKRTEGVCFLQHTCEVTLTMFLPLRLINVTCIGVLEKWNTKTQKGAYCRA